MAMTVAVTSNAAPRVRGFLASVMVEAAPGVYLGPRLNPAVRQRIVDVLSDWQIELGGAVTLLWQDGRKPGGLAMMTFGIASRELVELDGLFLSRTPLDGSELVKLGLRQDTLKTQNLSGDHPFVPSRGRPPAPALASDPAARGGDGP